MKDLRVVFNGLVHEATGRRADRALEAGAARYPALCPYQRAADLRERLSSADEVTAGERSALVAALFALHRERSERCWAAFLALAYWRGISSLRKRVSKARNREARTALILEQFFENAHRARSAGNLWLDTKRDVIRALREERLREVAHEQLAEDAEALGLNDVLGHLHDRGRSLEDPEIRVAQIFDELVAQGVSGRDAEAFARFEVYGDSAQETALDFYPDAKDRLQAERALRRARSRVRKRRLPGGAPQMLLPAISHSISLERLSR